MASDPVIELINVSFAYNAKPVLENVNLTVSDKEFVWVVGPNGGGKTTLVKLLLGLLQPKSGTVRVFGDSASSARRRIGYMPQQAHLDLRFPVTARDVVLMGRLNKGMTPGKFSGADREKVHEALELVGMDSMAATPLRDLSGGQQRRLLIARALACEPDMLLLDEPTANLDRKAERELFKILKKLNQRLTVIMISHDPAFVSDFVEQVVCVNRTVAVHPTTDRDREFIGELYGDSLRMVRHDKHADGDQ
ncbi:MAG: ABC transporter ATP-binding protein [Candidatus Zixiibacteriota bacterium]|nr:MAG: ABC transporter ATP-binding protein [candidate division Zixibacteria bacterium]